MGFGNCLGVCTIYSLTHGSFEVKAMILAAGRGKRGYLKKPVISVCEKWKFNAIFHGLWKIAEESYRGFVTTFSTSGASE